MEINAALKERQKENDAMEEVKQALHQAYAGEAKAEK